MGQVYILPTIGGPRIDRYKRSDGAPLNSRKTGVISLLTDPIRSATIHVWISLTDIGGLRRIKKES